MKGTVQYICKHKVIVDNLIEKNDPRNLFIAMISHTNADAFNEIILFFEDKKKCQESKEFMDYKRRE